jgi:hypothetical protein
MSVVRRTVAGDLPAPWVPPELPASKAPTVAERDRTKSLPAPWVPPELPASKAPTVAERDPKLLPAPWVPPPREAPRDLPAVVSEDRNVEPPVAPRQPAEYLPAEAVPQNTAPVIQQTIIVQQVVDPAPVYVVPGCPRLFCPLRAGRSCWRLSCWW